ncbi:MAG: NUDIX hydrolase [Methylococcaceae bacterium]|nr:NUDIX hydrolase [Methylococcaceae bacterium]
MYPTETPIGRPRVTVAAIVERQGRFLFVEERDPEGKLVINQPAGHVEAGESLPDALVRETFEETGWRVEPEALVGAYLWSRADGSISYLRIAMAAHGQRYDEEAPLDEGIIQPVWLSRDELMVRRDQHRSELVLRCLDDYLAGDLYPLTVLKSLLA